MTRFVGTPLRGIEFSSVSDEAISARVNGDGHPRIRIDAGGRITWSSGAATGDTTLYRDDENLLTTDDVFKATGGLVTVTTNGAPTAALPNGALAIDTTNHVFYFRSNNTWNQVTGGGGGGASVTVSDTPPESASQGDLWYESDTGAMFIYYDSSWIETVGAPSGSATLLDTLEDVSLTSPTNGQILKYNGTAWVNSAESTYTAPTGSVSGLSQETSTGLNIDIGGTTWVSIESISITPSTTSDKVFVIADFTAQIIGTLDSMAYMEFELRRGSTVIYNKYITCSMFDSTFTAVETLGFDVPFSMSYLDSPSTTSSTTYTLYGRGPYKSTSSGVVDFYVVNKASLQISAIKG